MRLYDKRYIFHNCKNTVYHKDFNTNKEQQIPIMSGIVKLELLFD